MSAEMIKSSLIELFSSPLKDGERRKIIYWQDIDGSLEEEFNNIKIENVKKHILVENNYFKTKYLLEVEDIESNFLIYTQEDLEVKKNHYPNEDNWLIDSILYSTVFYADTISIYCRELGIPNELRKIVLDNEKFFRANIRRQRFGSYNIERFTEEKIELGIISVLANQKSISLEDSLRTILMESLDENNNKYIK